MDGDLKRPIPPKLQFWIEKSASLVFLVGALALLAANVGSSQIQEVWIYSHLRLISLLGLLAAITYLVFSLFSPALSKINRLILIAALFNAVLVESVFHISPPLIPIELVELLPPDARNDIANARGLMTEDSIMGDGMLYSNNPEKYVNKLHPWVRIDQDGYRNPGRPKDRVDIVVLGDSVQFAAAARADLGEHFRSQGTQAYNLGMGGYSPFHYRDAYREHVISRGLAHNNVMVFISSGTDFLEAPKYLSIKRRGGDYKNYLGQGDTGAFMWMDKLPFFLPVILARSTPLILNKMSSIRSFLSSAAEPGGEVVLPYESYRITNTQLEIFEVTPQSAAWRDMETALSDIIEMAAGAKAEVSIVLMPNGAIILGDHIQGLDRQKEIMEKRYERILAMFRARFGNADNVRVLDATPVLASAMGRENIVAGRFDYHMNDKGMGILFRYLNDELGLFVKKN